MRLCLKIWSLYPGVTVLDGDNKNNNDSYPVLPRWCLMIFFFALINIRVTTSLPICLGLPAKSGLLASESLLLEARLVIYRYFTRLPSRTILSIFNLTSNSTCLLYTLTSLDMVILFAFCQSAWLKIYACFCLHSFDYWQVWNCLS